ncbi:hypothetical protein MM221_13645 [Salipaludibacillus sp. LMS25]|jgi:hypothetical protein|uniref:hypothetical protein n=1 Tax=Salipaludibacillus sp. LMS25 TaxID=2924031 RepID=UPI0020D12ECB|nr:hypothetical protein [Salipaludibacillus sp. LMS25]UTR13658.1 hypothetical protein MM221_13645 [Salipaludibacillus sp. LMS25]
MLYNASFCQKVVHGASFSSGVLDYLDKTQRAIEKNYLDMDLENASVQEEMGEIVVEMIKEIEALKTYVSSVHFK